MSEETVTISMKEYESLLDDKAWRESMESAGVDNWSGFDMGMAIYNGEDPV